MKEKALIIFFMVVVSYGFGQNSSLGVSFKPLISGALKTNRPVSNQYQNRVGWQLNGSYTHSFSKAMELSVGVGYSVWKVSFSRELRWPNMFTSTGIEKYRFKEIVFPLSLSLYSKGQNTQFFVTAGMEPVVVLAVENEYNLFEPPNEDDWRVKSVEEGITSFNLSVMMGLGVQFKISNRVSGVIVPEIQTNILKDSPKSYLWFSLAEGFNRSSLGVKFSIRYLLKSKKELRTLG